MLPSSVKDWHELSGLLVDVVLLVGALVAAIKFRLYNLLGHRWRSELTCTHYELLDSEVFTADYIINNTGQRPLRLREVTVRLTGARQDGVLVVPDEERTYASRVFHLDNPRFKGLFQIEPGERSIFPIRAKMTRLDEVLFVLCEFSLQHKRAPGAYRGFYVKATPAKPMTQESSKVKPPQPDEAIESPL